MKRRVLFVEDDANFRRVFARLMREALAPEQLDVAFVEAGTLAEARTRLREAGWTPRSSTSRCPTATGWTSWERSTTVAWATTSRPSC
jgi:CheY-like chemotaxis protein